MSDFYVFWDHRCVNKSACLVLHVETVCSPRPGTQYVCSIQYTRSIYRSDPRSDPRPTIPRSDPRSTIQVRSSTENKLYLQKVHTKSIKYTGPRIWNALNKEIRNAKSVKDFKDLYHRHSSQINQTKQATHWFKVWIGRLIVGISCIREWARLSIWCVVVCYPVC